MKKGGTKEGIKRRKLKADRKESMIPVRCTEDQKDALEKRAKARGIPLSTWLLSLGLAQPEKP